MLYIKFISSDLSCNICFQDHINHLNGLAIKLMKAQWAKTKSSALSVLKTEIIIKSMGSLRARKTFIGKWARLTVLDD